MTPSDLSHAAGPKAWVEKIHPTLLEILASFRDKAEEALRGQKSPQLAAEQWLIESLRAMRYIEPKLALSPIPGKTKRETDVQLWIALPKVLACCRDNFLWQKTKQLVDFHTFDEINGRRVAPDFFEPLYPVLEKTRDHYANRPTTARLLELLLGANQNYRPDRPIEPVTSKLAHALIVVFGELFGIWPGSDSDASYGVLSWGEAGELFEAFCPFCESHSAEQIRKLVKRSSE